MNITFFELEKWQEQEVKTTLRKHKLSFSKKPLTKRSAKKYQHTEVAAVFIYSQMTREVIDALPKLKLITTMSTGFDHIDVEYCKQKGITVCNVPTYGENTVAEHTFALILALSRKLYPSIKRTHEEGSFETDQSLRGFDLKGKTLGLIGSGNIGVHVARMARGFEMRVIVHDLRKNAKLAKEVGFSYVSFNKLLKESDIISVHVPHNKATHHLINAQAIKRMKKGVHVVNTARGGIIDTDALLKALKSGHIAGAGLDVLEEECHLNEEVNALHKNFKASCDLKTILEGHLLMKMKNVVVTPHNAFNSEEALLRILHTTLANIKAFSGKKAVNTV